MNYSDLIYDKIYNESWHKKLDSAQYNADLTVAALIRGTDTDKRY